MDVNKILSSDILDIIFDGKNKKYGAYDLRKTYKKRMRNALIATFSALALIIVATVFAGKFSTTSDKEDIDVLDTQMAEIKQDEPLPPPPPPPPPPPVPPPPPEVNQVKFTPPKIVKDEEVKPEEKIPDIQEDQVISLQTVESDNKIQIVQAPVVAEGSKVVELPVAPDENQIFTKVEIDASFPGGASAWSRYLRNNLNANAPIDKGAPPGTYTVTVKFIVSKDGSISQVSAETNHGYGMEDEAMKIIRRGPKWKPGIQNGREVNAYRRQPITFIVPDDY